MINGKEEFVVKIIRVMKFSFQCKICHYRLKNLTRIITESDGFLCERCLKSIRDREQSI